jgi:hypothetical protein
MEQVKFRGARGIERHLQFEVDIPSRALVATLFDILKTLKLGDVKPNADEPVIVSGFFASFTNYVHTPFAHAQVKVGLVNNDVVSLPRERSQHLLAAPSTCDALERVFIGHIVDLPESRRHVVNRARFEGAKPFLPERGLSRPRQPHQNDAKTGERTN